MSVGARLAYRNSTAEVLTWATDYKARAKAVHTARFEWMTALYDAHGVPEDDKARGAFIQGNQFSGLSWPADVPLPDHWFRPVKTPELVRPRATGPGKKLLAEMARFDRPDARHELSRRFGMPQFVFHGLGMYSNGIRFEDDGVWVTWGDAALHDEKEMRASKPEEHGWVRVPLVQFIERFGEDAL